MPTQSSWPVKPAVVLSAFHSLSLCDSDIATPYYIYFIALIIPCYNDTQYFPARMWVQLPTESRKGTKSSGTVVTGHGELPPGYWEQNQYELLLAELPF